MVEKSITSNPIMWRTKMEIKTKIGGLRKEIFFLRKQGTFVVL